MTPTYPPPHQGTMHPGLRGAEATAADYFQLLKPRVMSLVVFTAFTALAIAPGDLHPYLKFLVLLSITIGSGAAGALNMWWEYKLDAKMARTATRPLPRGVIKPASALAFGMLLAFFSLLLLGLASTVGAALWLAFTIFFYVVVYTIYLKPRTSQNIVWGGAAGALPPVVAWAAVQPSLGPLPWLLFFIIFFWTPSHFWALALVKAPEYEAAGIPVLPSTAGEPATRAQILLYTGLTVVCSLMPGCLSLLGPLYTACAGILGVGFLCCAIGLYREKINPMRFFAITIFYLFLLFLSMVLSVWVEAIP